MPSPFTIGDEKGLDSRSRTSHNGNLSRTFAVDMAVSLANTGIEGSARPIAHRRQGDGATHDLEERLRSAALLAGQFAEVWGASETAALAALWHDLGKYAAAFQAVSTASDPDA